MDLNSLIERYELREEDCEKKMSDKQLEEIALSYCRKWESLRSQLEMEGIVEHDIKKSQSLTTEEEKRRDFLLKWKNVKGSAATAKALINALLGIKSVDDAEGVCQLLQGWSKATTEQEEMNSFSTAEKPFCYILSKKDKIYQCGSLLVRDEENPDKYCKLNMKHSAVISCKSNEIMPVSREECQLLGAMDSPDERYSTYFTPGKLAWGLTLKVGDTVQVRLPDKKKRRSSFSSLDRKTPHCCAAVVRWIGEASDPYRDVHRFGVEIMDERCRGMGDTNGLIWDYYYFSCKKNCGLYVHLGQIEKPAPSDISYSELREHITQLNAEFCQFQMAMRAEVREEREVVKRLQEEMRQNRTEWSRKIQEQERASADIAKENVTKMNQVRQEMVECRHQLEEEQAQRRQLLSRIEGAAMLLQGQAATAAELWHLPREEVHVSWDLLGTSGWGRGTFRGKPVAIKCLHRAILSPHNEERVRHEISIMAQLRHPNLLLLIGAVLTTEREGQGPFIVTELLDTSLRSAYERRALKERSKVPVLQDVASALTYLHSHPILHRDVSSANVLLEGIRHERQWKAKLSDFWSANLSHIASTPYKESAMYAAPEVSMEEQTAKIDVYSFGVLVCEVCLCRFPPGRAQLPSMLGEVQCTAPDLFPLSRDCTSHAHQDRPTMREVLQRINNL